MKQQKGFTLIELLVTITILGVLAAIGLTSFKTANAKARDSRRAADIQQVRSALEMYKTDSDDGLYPVSSGSLSLIMGDISQYMSGQAVKDPKNIPPYEYIYDSDGLEYSLSYIREIDPSPSPVMFYNP